jgi:hypothetical protein
LAARFAHALFFERLVLLVVLFTHRLVITASTVVSTRLPDSSRRCDAVPRPLSRSPRVPLAQWSSGVVGAVAIRVPAGWARHAQAIRLDMDGRRHRRPALEARIKGFWRGPPAQPFRGPRITPRP